MNQLPHAINREERVEIVKMSQELIAAMDSNLERQFVSIVSFLADQPGLAKKLSGKRAPAFGTRDYLQRLAQDFVKGRIAKAPKPPQTVPDPAVSIVMNNFFEVPSERLVSTASDHLLSMASEGIVGSILEDYIAHHAEAQGWIWCAGSMVLSVDFIKPPPTPDSNWVMLQIKNRSNSENSSSSKVRQGTSILKWYRLEARNGESKWSEFPDPSLSNILTEESFQEHILDYLQRAT